MTPKISIIIAIYHCEKYIEVCARSLFEQTLDNIEYIFVNDATPDNSITILQNIIDEYPARKPFVKILSLRKNGGVSNARRIGIHNASGKYMIHADSDDWVDKDMYERLYQKAKETDADIVGCNFRHEFSDVQYDFHQQYGDTMEENISRLINGRIFPSLCTSLTRRSLIVDNSISFPEGLNMGEDLFFNLQLYLHAKKIVSMDWAPYHYRHTDSSSCVQRTRKSIESDIAIAGEIEKLMREKNLYEKYANEIEYRKFYSKIYLVKDFDNYDDYKLWRKIYPETNKQIIRYDIDLNLKIELWLAAHGFYYFARIIKHILLLQNMFRKMIKTILQYAF